MTLYRYGFIGKKGTVVRTRWTPDREMAHKNLEWASGQFSEPGTVAGDSPSERDGSHLGCERNGGTVFLEIKKLIP